MARAPSYRHVILALTQNPLTTEGEYLNNPLTTEGEYLNNPGDDELEIEPVAAPPRKRRSSRSGREPAGLDSHYANIAHAMAKASGQLK